MPAAIKILKYILIIIMMSTFTVCAPAKKNTHYNKKKKSSVLNATQLGRNKYFFSDTYQKKLNKNFRKNR